ncbi:MAG: hypothetical protein K2N68_03560 [Clostridia bacterium]|nr:hypothetical protein [Clostridia bacterium]
MKVKRVLKFYYSAEKLNETLDKTITRLALRSADYSEKAESFAEKICKVIETKKNFAALYGYLNEIMCGFCESEIKTLEYYAKLRKGILTLPDGTRREVKRVVTKFTRKCRGLERFKEGLKAVDAYFAVM